MIIYQYTHKGESGEVAKNAQGVWFRRFKKGTVRTPWRQCLNVITNSAGHYYIQMSEPDFREVEMTAIEMNVRLPIAKIEAEADEPKTEPEEPISITQQDLAFADELLGTSDIVTLADIIDQSVKTTDGHTGKIWYISLDHHTDEEIKASHDKKSFVIKPDSIISVEFDDYPEDLPHYIGEKRFAEGYPFKDLTILRNSNEL